MTSIDNAVDDRIFLTLKTSIADLYVISHINALYCMMFSIMKHGTKPN